MNARITVFIFKCPYGIMWNNINKSEIGCVLAALILSENDIEILDTSIIDILDSAKIKFDSLWPSTFVRLSKCICISELMGYNKNATKINLQKTVNKIENVNYPSSETFRGKKTPKALSQKESDEGDLGLGLFD